MYLIPAYRFDWWIGSSELIRLIILSVANVFSICVDFLYNRNYLVKNINNDIALFIVWVICIQNNLGHSWFTSYSTNCEIINEIVLYL